MNDVSKKVVILLAHPNLKESQANKALADAVKDIDGVMVYDLYEYQDQSFDVNVWSTMLPWWSFSSLFTGCQRLRC